MLFPSSINPGKHLADRFIKLKQLFSQFPKHPVSLFLIPQITGPHCPNDQAVQFFESFKDFDESGLNIIISLNSVPYVGDKPPATIKNKPTVNFLRQAVFVWQ